MKPLLVTGLQWGDEGKGKFIDFLGKKFDATVRFNGGNNAGHTVVYNKTTLHLSLIPSSILHQKTVLISQAVIINPQILLKEIKLLKKLNINLKLGIDPRCHIVMPYHQALDSASEEYKGKKKTGSLKLGIGFCYEDRTNRAGIRLIDLINPRQLRKKINAVWNLKQKRVTNAYKSKFNLNKETAIKQYQQYGKLLKPYIKDISSFVNQNINKKSFLFESAQGAYLDFAFGTYPYTVAYHTTSASALTSIGLPPMKINVLGIVKAYTTRVGNGPFPTELTNKINNHLRNTGHEYGTVSKRSRRCGWLDLVLIKKAININGVNSIALTKLDVLSGLKQLKICTHYTLNNKTIRQLPLSLSDILKLKPQYIVLPGWSENITNIKKISILPKNCQKYINFIGKKIKIPLKYISVGPDRNQTIINLND